MEKLPDDCIFHVFTFLTINDLVSVSETSKSFHKLVFDEYLNQNRKITVTIDMEFLRRNKTIKKIFEHLKNILDKNGEIIFIYCKILNERLFSFNRIIDNSIKEKNKKLLTAFNKIFTHELLQNENFISYIHTTTPIRFPKKKKEKSSPKSFSRSIHKFIKSVTSPICSSSGKVEISHDLSAKWIILKIRLLAIFEVKNINHHINENEWKIILEKKITGGLGYIIACYCSFSDARKFHFSLINTFM
jgi:hypothetical protein